MTVHVTFAEAEAKLAELLEIASSGEVVAIEVEGREPLFLSRTSPGRRPVGVWAQYGPMQDPDLFFRPDAEMEAAADAPLLPQE